VSLSWTQPICEACWIKQNIVIDEDNIEIREPVMVRSSEIEKCAYCGKPTIVGIYKRDDPANVTYPREKE
jgi:hypothetical protein